MKKSLLSVVLFLLALCAAPFAQAQSCGSGGGATVCLNATGSNINVALTWTFTGSISSVQIYRNTSSSTTGRSRIASVSSTTTQYVDGNAATGTTYWYWVKFSAGGKSYNSNAAAATHVVVTSLGGGGTPSTPGTMRSLTSLQLSQLMAPGINLGNTLESIGGETAWGNPQATQAMMSAIKAAGFNSVRIPLSWSQYADSNDNIRADWMARVTEVVNYAHNAGLYAIINIHWDGGWMDTPTYAQQATINARITKFWTQIANNFKNYDDTLLFAGTNEVMMTGDYSTPTVEYYTVQNSFNQAFVNAVRATSGNNVVRHLIVQAFNTGIEWAMDYFTVPTDSAANRLMLEVHYYDPFDFTINTGSDTIWQWGSIATSAANTETWANESYVDTQFNRLQQRFIAGMGMPVLVGEYASVARLSVDSAQTYRTYWDQYITKSARQHGLVPVYWDDGYSGNHTMGLFNRSTGAQYYPNLTTTIVNAQ